MFPIRRRETFIFGDLKDLGFGPNYSKMAKKQKVFKGIFDIFLI
jgi:hypothetical protein